MKIFERVWKQESIVSAKKQSWFMSSHLRDKIEEATDGEKSDPDCFGGCGAIRLMQK